MSGRIIAVIGSESHTTSRGWANVHINGKKMSYRDATSTEWKTKFGDKHASWCECLFKVEPGDTVTWEAGANSGNRGSDRTRINQTYVFDPVAEIAEIEGPGYPAREAMLTGRLVLQADAVADKSEAHEALKAAL